jgi:hypothetical protein
LEVDGRAPALAPTDHRGVRQLQSQVLAPANSMHRSSESTSSSRACNARSGTSRPKTSGPTPAPTTLPEWRPDYGPSRERIARQTRPAGPRGGEAGQSDVLSRSASAAWILPPEGRRRRR